MNIQILEEATYWLVLHRSGSLDKHQKIQFDAWLRTHPQHLRAYLEMSALWEDVGSLDPGWNSTPAELIAQARIDNNVLRLAPSGHSVVPGTAARTTIPGAAAKPGRPGPHRSATAGSPRSIAAAAMILLAVSGMLIWRWLNANIYATGVGEQRTISLADGSAVELSSRSRLRVHYTRDLRGVQLLEGQALFEVAHDTTRPFIVDTGAASVRAVGTQFDVYKKRAGTVVTVIEGRVAVVTDATPSATAPDIAPRSSAARPSRQASLLLSNSSKNARNSILLIAGEQLTVPIGQVSVPLVPAVDESPHYVNVAVVTAWTKHRLIFDAAPLSNVVEEFNRYNERQIVILDPALENIRITGVFSSMHPELLLRFLRAQDDIDVEETRTEIRLAKR